MQIDTKIFGCHMIWLRMFPFILPSCISLVLSHYIISQYLTNFISPIPIHHIKEKEKKIMNIQFQQVHRLVIKNTPQIKVNGRQRRNTFFIREEFFLELQFSTLNGRLSKSWAHICNCKRNNLFGRYKLREAKNDLL